MQILGLLTYIFLFVCYSILISHPRMEKWERILYGIIFGVSILAPLGAFYNYK
jgi:hypothetical protein